MRTSAFALTLVSLLACAPRAFAYEDRISIEVGGGFATASGANIPGPGAGADLWLTWGFSNTLTLRAFGGYAVHPSTDRIADAGVDLIYMIDAFAFVPYAGLGIDGVLHHRNAAGTTAGFGLHAVVGLDFLMSDAVHMGFEARPTFVLTQFFEMPLYLKIGFAFDV